MTTECQAERHGI